MSDYIFENIDTITLDTSKATLTSKKWSSVSSILKNYKIIEKNGTGIAIITRDPSPQEYSIDIEIKSSFSNNLVSPENWGLKVADYINPIDYAKHLQGSKLLEFYLTVLKEKYLDDVNDSLIRFSNIRDYKKIDFDLLIDTLSTLGFNIDVSTGDNEFKEDVYRRLLEESVQYYTTSGTKYTLDFLSYIHSSFLAFETLYTKDYNFFTSTPPSDDKDYYLTSRVNILYDVINYISKEDIIRLKEIFYKLAPANIVINSFIGKFLDSLDLEFLVSQSVSYYSVTDDLNAAQNRLISDSGKQLIFDDYEYIESDPVNNIVTESFYYLVDNSGNRIITNN